jgi:hypothetical protein
MKKIVVLLSLGLALVAFGCSGNGGDGNGGDGGTGGTGGTGGSTLCTGVDCTSDNQCVEDGTCDPTDGSCVAGDPKPQDTSCTEDGGTLCDGAGKCVQCNTAGQCDDLQECTTDSCESDGSCTNTPVADDTACAGDAGTCQAGVCDLCAGNDCSDDNECTTDTCNASDGLCTHTAVADDTACAEDAGTCQSGTCDLCTPNRCDDSMECTQNICAPADASCTHPNESNGTTCSTGICTDGVCGAAGMCAGKDCSDGMECTEDLCEPSTGICSNPNLAIDFVCTEGGGQFCDGAGNCVECNDVGQCTDDGNECTTDPSCTNNACAAQVNKGDGTACADGAGTCQSGVCQVPPTFALGGEFRAFNPLLPPDTACEQPNLSLVPGANLTGISSKCVIVFAPDVGGSLTFTNTGGQNWDVDGNVALEFTIDAVIPAPPARVLVVTSSDTPYSGTGTGTVSDGGTIAMNTLSNAVVCNSTQDCNVQAGTACFCDPTRDANDVIVSYTACGTNNNNGPGGVAGTCPNPDQLCAKPRDGQFFPGGCVTGAANCSAFGTTGAGDACGCPDGPCMTGGSACTCADGVCNAGGTSCNFDVDCPLSSKGQRCSTRDGSAGTCDPLFGVDVIADGYCPNPGQTCTGGFCDNVGDPGAGAFCVQSFGQACLGGKCQPVDISVSLCPIANLQAGDNLTPLPGDQVQRALPDIEFFGAPKLNMRMDGGPSVPGGWYVNNPPNLASNGTQFLSLTGVQQ